MTTTALSLALVGCIAFVDTSDVHTTCAFRGETTTCGACLASHCRARIDACCVDSVSSSALTALDACASASAVTECAGLSSSTATTASASLAACFDASCVDACVANECGRCILRSCAAEVTACHADEGCDVSTIFELQQCTAHAQYSERMNCGMLYYPGTDPSPTVDGQMRQCVTQHCAPVCPVD